MRWSASVLSGLLLVTAFVSGVRAQETEEKKESECVCPRAWTGQVRVLPYGEDVRSFYFGGRPRLGVWVHREANPETDNYGALLDGVMKGGPADEAGLQEGDIITKLDGQSLTSGSESYDEDQSAPGQRLVERSQQLEAGDTVEVEYRRDGDTQTVDLVVGEFEDPFAWALEYSAPRAERIGGLVERFRTIPEVHVSGPSTFALRLGERWPGLELVSLNPELGDYFGTGDGVLVVSIPEDNELNLKAGDVIQAIDGRQVKSPSHTMRILRSYDADEEVSFEVVRQKRTTTVTGKVTGGEGFGPYRIQKK